MTHSQSTHQSVAGRASVPAISHLSEQDIQAFGDEVSAIGKAVMNDLGPGDERYLRGLLWLHRSLEVGGRLIIFAGILHPALFVLGAVVLGLAKILDNMEIGHNVLHGQWNWLGDPKIHSSRWDWDNVCPASQWQRSHNRIHHKWTNVIGRDRDYGYEALRVSDKQPWRPFHLFQPVINFLMAIYFQWGVAIHDDELAAMRTGERDPDEVRPKLHKLLRKIARQVSKDYLLFPLLAGPYFLPVLFANMGANLMRNVWAYAVIFCGHFSDGVEDFHEEAVENEDKARWYLRQILGSANIEGGPWLHFWSGNLSHQIEHHLFPAMPSNRYREVAPKIRALCHRYRIPYNSRPLLPQLFSVWRKVFRYSLPPRLST